MIFEVVNGQNCVRITENNKAIMFLLYVILLCVTEEGRHPVTIIRPIINEDGLIRTLPDTNFVCRPYSCFSNGAATSWKEYSSPYDLRLGMLLKYP